MSKMATSIEDAWGISVAEQRAPATPPPVPRKSTKRVTESGNAETLKLLTLVLNEIRHCRNESVERHKHIMLAVCISTVIMLLFLAIIWQSSQRAHLNMSYLIWHAQQSRTLPYPSR